jgi:hypothetical protein
MNGDDHDDTAFWVLSHWWGFASPVGLAILLIGAGGFLVLLAEAVAIPLSLFR